MLFLIRKRHIKGGKHIASMDFAEHLRKSDVSEKFIIGNFYEMDFMKDTWNLLATVYWSRDTRDKMEMDDESCFAEICPYVFYIPPLIRGRHSLVRNTAAEKKVDIAI